MSNIWGAGGLFESALANKLANQDAKSQADLMSANANLMNAASQRINVGNNYDIGLRNADTNRLAADNNYDIGLRNAASNAVNANANLFGAETDRLAKSGPSLITTTVANNLGLRSYNPVSQKDATEYGNNYGGANLMASQSHPEASATSTAAANVTTPSATPAAAANVTTPSATPAPTTQAPLNPYKAAGMKRGGKVTKMGCKDGGKIGDADNDGDKIGSKGRKGGEIGDVDKDTGEDTVDVKAREGEYFLNPETVAYLGGGNYDAGVRNLNQIVRQATGKEPGPTRVGESKKVGFMQSGPMPTEDTLEGFVNANRSNKPETLRNINVERPTIYVASDEVASTDPNMGVAKETAAKAEAEAGATRTGRWSKAGAEAGKYARDTAIPAIKGAANTAANALKKYGPGAIGDLAAAAVADNTYSHHRDFYNDDSVPVLDKVEQIIRDIKGPALTAAGGAFGSGFGSAAFGVGALPGFTIGSAAGGVLANQFDDEGESLREYRKTHKDPGGLLDRISEGLNNEGVIKTPVAPAANTPEAAKTADATPTKEKDASDTKEEKPSMRDMLLNRLQNIDRVAATNGGLGSSYWNNARGETVKALLDNEQALANAGSAQAAAKSRNSDDLQKMIASRFTTIGEDGKPVFNAAAAADFQKQYIDKLSNAGADVSGIDPYEVGAMIGDYDARARTRDRVNDELGGLRDGYVGSNMLNNSDIVGEREMAIDDFLDSNNSTKFWRDYVPSLWRNGDYDRVIEINRGGTKFAVPESRLMRDSKGNVDIDVLNQYPSLRRK